MNCELKSPLVSVIVPVYKAEAYLHKCVDSLLAQTMTDFEVLLIDDGSPDRSGAICDEYAAKDSRIRVFHKENGGVASARQVGIENVRGEYTIHADPDDWVEPTMLEELYAKAKEDDADMVICDIYMNFYEKEIYTFQDIKKMSVDFVLVELLKGKIHGSLCNKLVKSSCFFGGKVNFNISLSLGEDLSFCCKLLNNENFKISYLNRAYYHYIQHNNVNSQTKERDKNKRLLNGINLYDDLKSFFSKSNLLIVIDDLCKYRELVDYFVLSDLSSIDFYRKYHNHMKFVKYVSSSRVILKVCLFFSCLGFYVPMKKIYFLDLWFRNNIKRVYANVKKNI